MVSASLDFADKVLDFEASEGIFLDVEVGHGLVGGLGALLAAYGDAGRKILEGAQGLADGAVGFLV